MYIIYVKHFCIFTQTSRLVQTNQSQGELIRGVYKFMLFTPLNYNVMCKKYIFICECHKWKAWNPTCRKLPKNSSLSGPGIRSTIADILNLKANHR